jgi:GMP synthase (glutamine-hydrolysing)
MDLRTEHVADAQRAVAALEVALQGGEQLQFDAVADDPRRGFHGGRMLRGVYPGGKKEIGWSGIRLTDAGERSCLAALASQPVLHWHGDTFDLPQGAQLLASSDVYENQAFSLGNNVLALQFHAEADSRRIEQWLIGHTCELSAAGIDIAALRKSSHATGPGLRVAGARMLGDWLEQLAW